MKFKLVDTYRYWWPVTVRIPHPDVAGTIQEQTLKVLFEAQDREDALAAQELYETLVTPRERAEHETTQLLAVVKGWDDVEGEDKAPVPFTEDNFRAALQKAWFRSAVYAEYANSLSGREAQVKN